MSPTIRRVAGTAVLSAVVGLVGAACSSSNSASTTTTEATSSTTRAQSFQIATPDGQVSLSLDGKLPPGWPADFPVPSGADPAGSGSLGGEDSTVRIAVFTTGDSGENALDFYSQNSTLTTSDRKAAGVGNTFAGSVQITAPYTGNVTVAGHDGTTYIIVILKGDTATTSTTSAGGGASTTSTTQAGTTSTTGAGATSTPN